MIHARRDYDRIQDPQNIIPADEPVFLLRGQDIAAPVALNAWIKKAQEIGVSQKMIVAAIYQSEAMVKWQMEHDAKIPNLPGEETIPVFIEYKMGKLEEVGQIIDEILNLKPADTVNLDKIITLLSKAKAVTELNKIS